MVCKATSNHARVVDNEQRIPGAWGAMFYAIDRQEVLKNINLDTKPRQYFSPRMS